MNVFCVGGGLRLAGSDAARYKLDQRKASLSHRYFSPVTGIVKSLKLNTQGGVLRAGDELMQISPAESDRVVEVKVNPVDKGQLQIGLPVSIKLAAFDYAIYGGLQGSFSYISSDTLTEQINESSMTYCGVQISVAKAVRNNNPIWVNIPLKPGMTSTVGIQTSKQSVVHYLAKPVISAFGGALY